MGDPVLTWIDVREPRLDAIERTLAAHPRRVGHYILRLIDIALIRTQVSEERMLDALFEHFAGRTWPPFEERVALGSWRDSIATADDAGDEVVGALVGGKAVGHTTDTMNAAVAARIWADFASLFASDRTYFRGLGLGDPAYVYLRGAAIVDATRAGYLGVVEGD
jgi:hypothetical protein